MVVEPKVDKRVTRHLGATTNSTRTPSEQVRGLLATDHTPPNDDEIKSILVNTLEEKHSPTNSTSTERLQGILDLGDAPITKDQIRDTIADYLIDKYR